MHLELEVGERADQLEHPRAREADKAKDLKPLVEEPPDEDEKDDPPQVLHASTMSRSEKLKVQRIVTPKSYTGRLEVPQGIFEMWQTPKGKQKLFEMWAKSGGVKARAQSTFSCVPATCHACP